MIFAENRHQGLSAELFRKRRETTNIHHQHRALTGHALTRLNFGLRPGNLARDIGVEESRQIPSLGFLDHRADEHGPGPVDGEGKDQRHHHDGNHLVKLGAQQDDVTGHVIYIIAGHRAATRGRITEQDEPPDGRREPRQKHVIGLEPQRPEGDEYENVEQRGRLQIKRRGLAVLDVEAPNGDHQKGHVGNNRQRQHPRRQPETVSHCQPQQCKHEVAAESVRHRIENHLGVDGFRRDDIKRREGQHHGKLDPTDQDLALVLLANDRLADSRRQLLHRRCAD